MAQREVPSVELTPPEMTRWSAQLTDRDQEFRFRIYNMRAGRRTAVTALLLILGADAAMVAYRLLVADQPMGLTRLITQIAATIVGAGLAIWLMRERRHTWMVAAVLTAAALLTALTAVLIATAVDGPFKGAVLLIGGVAVIYLVVPLTLRAVAALALGFSAVTLPIWLVTADEHRSYTVLAVCLAHLLSAVEARRTRQERRVLFAQREMLLALSSIDPLTGLVNRRAVDVELGRAWEYWSATGTPVSVLMIDIDHFKNLNDTQGHIAGDHALRLVADVVREVMPLMPGQVAARYGGEEFCCLLTGLDAAAAAVVAGRILAEVRRIGIPLTATSGSRTILTVSVGVAQARPGMAAPEHLVAAADRQLYRAKGEGRNCVRAELPGERRDDLPLQKVQ